MRVIHGFRAVRCVAPAPDGTLFVVGRHDKVGGTALWEVRPDGRTVRCGPASATFTDWVDVFGTDPELYGVALRHYGFTRDHALPARPMPVTYERRPDGEWAYTEDLGRFWAGGRLFVELRPEDDVDLLAPPHRAGGAATAYRMGGLTEYAVDRDGVTALVRVVTVVSPSRPLSGGYVEPADLRTDWRIYRLPRDGSPLGPPTEAAFPPDADATPCSGGVLVGGWWFGRGVADPCLVTGDRAVLPLAGVVPGDIVLDAAPGLPTLSTRRSGRSRPARLLAVDGRTYKFTGDRSVVGARLSPDGLTAYAWTQTELIQIDL